MWTSERSIDRQGDGKSTKNWGPMNEQQKKTREIYACNWTKILRLSLNSWRWIHIYMYVQCVRCAFPLMILNYSTFCKHIYTRTRFIRGIPHVFLFVFLNCCILSISLFVVLIFMNSLHVQFIMSKVIALFSA